MADLSLPAMVVEEDVPLIAAQQQQAEQMKVFWKVCASTHLSRRVLTAAIVHRGNATKSGFSSCGQDPADAQICTGIRSFGRTIGPVHGGSSTRGARDGEGRHVETIGIGMQNDVHIC